MVKNGDATTEDQAMTGELCRVDVIGVMFGMSRTCVRRKNNAV